MDDVQQVKNTTKFRQLIGLEGGGVIAVEPGKIAEVPRNDWARYHDAHPFRGALVAVEPSDVREVRETIEGGGADIGGTQVDLTAARERANELEG